MGIEKSDFYAIFIFALALGLPADCFFYRKAIGISFFVFNFLIVVLAFVLASKLKEKTSRKQILVMAAALALSAGLFLRSNGFLGLFDFFGVIYLVFLFWAMFPERKLPNFNILGYTLFPLAFI